jgi:shikimate kinase
MKIYLIGLPGSGKTTLGKRLASHLNLPFVDLDHEIELKEGAAIKDFFNVKGEDYFRQLESEILKKFSTQNADFIMATGGGAPVFHDNLKVMNASGKTIFLDVPPSEIANRILRTNPAKRPLLANLAPDDLKDKIEFMRSQRIAFYNQATIKISGANIEIQEILKAINPD